MAAGFGVDGIDPAATRAVGSLRKPAGRQSNDLARAAIDAVAKLAKSSGHPINDAPGASSPCGGGSTALIVVVLALAALGGAGTLVLAQRRRTDARRPCRGRVA